ncbi:MAG TPA: hypothetical protein VMH22_13275 [bacterium]|nr:hypothetical protein [bacterium]
MLFGNKKTYVIDYETLTDPRIAEFIAFGLMQGKLLLPEPDHPTDKGGNDHAKRRAWETIEKLKAIPGVTVKLDKNLLKKDQLLAAVRKNKATLVTADPNLKTALGDGSAVTTSEIYNLFRPTYLPGTELKVRIAKKGKETDEGIGYLEGGIKVVVSGAANTVGQEIEVVIQGGLDTDVGRVVFAKPRFAEVK